MLGGGERVGPVAQRELDRGDEAEIIRVVRVEPDRFLRGEEGLAVLIEPVVHQREDVVKISDVWREPEGSLGGFERRLFFILLEAAEREERVGLRVVGRLREGERGLALGVGGARLLEEELGAGEVGAHGWWVGRES